MNKAHLIMLSMPLLRRTQLLPGESLPSLLERLAQRNYYPSSRILSTICRQQLEPPAIQDNLANPQWVETYLRLAELTCISPEELYDASNHRFASIFTLPHQSQVEMPWIGPASKAILPLNLAYERLHFAASAQYCPLCLKNAAYHRLNWIPIATAICLEHRCLLLSQCPRCRKHISIREITEKHCCGCLKDLSTAESIPMEGDELGILSQQIIQSWLMGTETTDLSPMHGLPSRHPAVLYRFLENMSRRLLDCWEAWPTLSEPLDGLHKHIPVPVRKLQNLSPDGAFHLLRAALTSIINWPDGLFQFLDAYTGYSSSMREPVNHVGQLAKLRQKWYQSGWKTPGFEFVQQGLVNYSLARDIPLPVAMAEEFTKVAWFIEQTGLWSKEQTAQTLGISVQKLDQLLSNDTVASCRWPRSRTKEPLFEREKVLLLKQKWLQGWPIRDASRWLGLCSWDVLELAKRGALEVVGKPDVNQTNWVLSRHSVECFFESITDQLKLFRGDSYDLLSLGDVSRVTAYFEMDCSTLLQGVSNGSLPALKKEMEVHSLERIYFLGDSVRELPDLYYAQRGWIAGHKFIHEKGLQPYLVTEWVNAGLVRPEAIFGEYRYFVRQHLERLAISYAPALGQSHYL
jgi:hypothetical protein